MTCTNPVWSNQFNFLTGILPASTRISVNTHVNFTNETWDNLKIHIGNALLIEIKKEIT